MRTIAMSDSLHPLMLLQFFMLRAAFSVYHKRHRRLLAVEILYVIYILGNVSINNYCAKAVGVLTCWVVVGSHIITPNPELV